MRFKYQGFDRTARPTSGELDAVNEADAKAKLRALAIRPTRLMSIGGGIPKTAAGLANFDLAQLFQGSAAPDLIQFTAFIRQMATMQEAGIPIVQSLSILGEQAENRAFGAVVSSVSKNIEGGMTLTDALRKYPKVFDKVFINLIAAGEISGSLDKVLLRLATFYEKSAQLRRKIKSAMMYPIIIICLVVVVVIGMLYFVVPKFQQMFSGNGAELPAATQVVIDISKFVQGNIVYLLLGLAIVVGMIVYIFKNEDMRKQIDPLLLQMPIFGNIIMKVGIARFSRTLGTMIQSGVPILEALDITGRVAGNFAIEQAIAKVRQSITEGNTISAPLEKAKVFPKMAVSMIAVGEQTGALDTMLAKVAEFYEDEVDAAVSGLTSILEPMLIIIVGVVVVSIIIPMYLPVFKMGDMIGNK